jgi:hypothetical protein
MLGLLASGLVAAGLAACGSSGSGSPLQTELSYLPANSPLVVTVQTDPKSAAVKNTMSLLGRFQFTAIAASAVITHLRAAGVDYYTDVEPLFGNPVVVAITGSPTSHDARSRFVAVWVTKSGSALSSLVQKPSSGLHNVGSHDGVPLYRTRGSTTLAVDGATLIAGPNPAAVTSALDRHANGTGMSPSLYARSTAGLPGDALVRVFGSVQQLLAASSHGSAAARVPWVAAVRGYGVSISMSNTGVSVRYHVDTSGSTLTSAQLPLSPSAGAPRLPQGLPIAAGLSDPKHVVTFVEAAEQASAPAKYAKFQRRQAALRARTGADLNQLLGELTGSLLIASDGHATLGRSEVSDPKKTAQILAKLAKDPRDAFQTGSVTQAGGFYVFHNPNGDTLLGLVANKLVAGHKANPGQVKAFAGVTTSPVAGAQGPFAFTVSLAQLVTLATRGASSRIPPAILAALGNLTGWASNTTSGLDGTAAVSVK